MKKLLVLLAVISIVATASIMAQPNLQIYTPAGTYVNETWVISESSFWLYVVVNLYDGIIDPAHRVDLYDIQLVASLGQTGDKDAGSFEIYTDDTKTTQLATNAWVNDTPPLSEDWTYAPHGIYPSWFTELTNGVVGSTVGLAANDDIYDFQDPITGPSSKGIVYKYWVETTYDFIHFDAYGWTDPNHGKENKIFAPNSHDAEYIVPEPATMALFGLGLLGAGVVRRFRHKK